MQFITSGQRIATENFEQGVIYKVTFIDDNITYMMCAGIGSDFVMLMSSEPRLFSLTIDSASLISEIDIHDPTPPEPPTPLENVLQYQTGEPPFTFTTTESSLFSWYIEGAAGVKTANLFEWANTWSGTYYDVTYTPINKSSFRIEGLATSGKIIDNPVSLTGTYTISITVEGTINDELSHSVNVYLGETRKILTFNKTQRYTTDTVTGTITNINTIINRGFDGDITIKIMLVEGSTPKSYEPYGYKISIYNNEHTTTIYLDEPIAEGEKLYSVNINAQIETDIGENTLSVSDPQPPEMQIVYGIYAEG